MYIPLRPATLGVTDNDATGMIPTGAPEPMPVQYVIDTTQPPLTLVTGGGTLENTGAFMNAPPGYDPMTGYPLVPVTTPPAYTAPDGTLVPPNTTIYVPAPAPAAGFVTAPAPAPAPAPSAIVVQNPDGSVTPAPVLVAPIVIQPSGPGVTIPATMPGDYTGDFQGTPIPGDTTPVASRKSGFGMLAALAALLTLGNN